MSDYAKYNVGPSGTDPSYPYTGIAAAMTAAHATHGVGAPGVVLVAPGLYSGDVQTRPGIALRGTVGVGAGRRDGTTPCLAATLAGALYAPLVAGDLLFEDLDLELTDSLTLPGTARNDVVFRRCRLAISASAPVVNLDATNGSTVRFEDCVFLGAETGAQVVTALGTGDQIDEQVTFVRCAFDFPDGAGASAGLIVSALDIGAALLDCDPVAGTVLADGGGWVRVARTVLRTVQGSAPVRVTNGGLVELQAGTVIDQTAGTVWAADDGGGGTVELGPGPVTIPVGLGVDSGVAIVQH